VSPFSVSLDAAGGMSSPYEVVERGLIFDAAVLLQIFSNTQDCGPMLDDQRVTFFDHLLEDHRHGFDHIVVDASKSRLWRSAIYPACATMALLL
jgi:hypothetical protein